MGNKTQSSQGRTGDTNLIMLTATKSLSQTPEPQYANWKKLFAYKSNSRYRWNVLDLLSIFGGRACVSHITVEVDMTEIESKRRQHKSAGQAVTVTAFIIKAIALAQLMHPQSRTFALPFGRTVTYQDIVAGFTAEREVEAEPIVFFGEIEEPHLKSISAIADQLKEYVERDIMTVPKLRTQVIFARLPWLLRRLVLTAARYFPFFRLMCMKSTFGVSSLGALGVATCYGPSVCSCVFGVGAVEKRVEARQGELVVRDMMTLSLSFDQKVMDGGSAARIIADVRKTLESGMSLE